MNFFLFKLSVEKQTELYSHLTQQPGYNAARDTLVVGIHLTNRIHQIHHHKTIEAHSHNTM